MKAGARATAFLAAVVFAALLMGSARPGASAPSTSVTLRVMSFNIFYGGD